MQRGMCRRGSVVSATLSSEYAITVCALSRLRTCILPLHLYIYTHARTYSLHLRMYVRVMPDCRAMHRLLRTADAEAPLRIPHSAAAGSKLISYDAMQSHLLSAPNAY